MSIYPERGRRPKTLEQRARAYATLDYIEANQDRHDQVSWVSASHTVDKKAVEESCETTACYAGWTVLLAGMRIVGGMYVDATLDTASYTAGKLLGMSNDEREWLFHESKDLADVRKTVFEIFGPRPDEA